MERNTKKHASFEAFTAVKFQVTVFWIVTPCSAVVGYQHFESNKQQKQKAIST